MRFHAPLLTLIMQRPKAGYANRPFTLGPAAPGRNVLAVKYVIDDQIAVGVISGIAGVNPVNDRPGRRRRQAARLSVGGDVVAAGDDHAADPKGRERAEIQAVDDLEEVRRLGPDLDLEVRVIRHLRQHADQAAFDQRTREELIGRRELPPENLVVAEPDRLDRRYRGAPVANRNSGGERRLRNRERRAHTYTPEDQDSPALHPKATH